MYIQTKFFETKQRLQPEIRFYSEQNSKDTEYQNSVRWNEMLVISHANDLPSLQIMKLHLSPEIEK